MGDRSAGLEACWACEGRGSSVHTYGPQCALDAGGEPVTRRPLDIVTKTLLGHFPAVPALIRVARDVLDALTADPDVRERVGAIVREATWVAFLRANDPAIDDLTEGAIDAVLAALRDDEPVTRPFSELRDAHYAAHPGAAERVANKVREIRDEEGNG